jgi:outer membrane protein assembly factor BamD (BamD/ComL family)
MKRTLILILSILPLLIFCSKKEVKVNSLDNMEPPALLEKGNAAFYEGNMEEAIKAYDVIYKRYPLSREYISAVLGMARAYNNTGDFEKGFSLLYNLIRENMVPSRVPEIYNEMARYYEVTAIYSKEAGISRVDDDYKKAIDYYQKSVDYPNSEDPRSKSYAQYQIGELELKLGQPEQAALSFQSTIYKYPHTEWATLAQQRIEQMKQEGQTTLSPLKAGQIQKPEKNNSEINTAVQEEIPPEPVTADSSANPDK